MESSSETQDSGLANETPGVDIDRVTMMRAPLNVHPTHAEIDLEALRHNLAIVRRTVGPTVKIMAVVKSNGYGHGVLSVAQVAVSSGAEFLAVARVDEGVELRRSGISCPILVFELVANHQINVTLEHGLDFTVASVGDAGRISLAAKRLNNTARVHVKVDTGMGRLGMKPEVACTEIRQIVDLSHVEVVAVWSHFATADAPDQTYAREQLTTFQRVLEDLDRANIRIPLKHMANSAALLKIPESHFDMVRPGIMLYGFAPSRTMAQGKELLPVMSLISRVSFVKSVEAGSGISYGRTFSARMRTNIATVPIGYADGYSRRLSNRGSVLIGGRRYPVVGTVCMDHLMVDVGDEDLVRENDIVTLIGADGEERITCWDLADVQDTIPYEIMCAVSARVPRVVLEKEGR